MLAYFYLDFKFCIYYIIYMDIVITHKNKDILNSLYKRKVLVQQWLYQYDSFKTKASIKSRALARIVLEHLNNYIKAFISRNDQLIYKYYLEDLIILNTATHILK